MSQFLIKAAQFLIAAAVGSFAIWYSERINYHINGYIIAAWAFMASYGATMLAVWLLDRYAVRRHARGLGVEQGTDKRIDI